MRPDASKITIHDNLNQIEQFINDMIISPKQMLKRWSVITRQTNAIKLGYIGQHLASLITGVKGTGTGARGDDLADKTEVKSCNKLDQVDKCKVCKARVLRYETVCPECGSTKIDRKEDSKWLFTVRTEAELNQYLNMDRVFLLLMDYPNFDANDFNDIRITSYEIYPKEPRMAVLGQLLSNHYWNIFLPKLQNNQNTNPMNFHPFSYQFFKANPIKTFECIIQNIETDPILHINQEVFISPEVDRNENIKSLDMPTTLLKDEEWDELLRKADFESEIRPLLVNDISYSTFRYVPKKDKAYYLPLINEHLRDYLSLREITSVTQQTRYVRH